MFQANVTITLCLPENIEQQFYKIINDIFSKFGKYRLKNDKDGIYYNIPHITLLSLGNCLDKKDEICKRLKPILMNFKPIKIKSKRTTCFSNGAECHLVIELKKTQELLDLHKKVYASLKDLFEGDKKFILDNFCPHITIISSIPKDLAPKINKIVNIKNLEFISNQISIKTKIQGKHAVQYKVFQLEN